MAAHTVGFSPLCSAIKLRIPRCNNAPITADSSNLKLARLDLSR